MLSRRYWKIHQADRMRLMHENETGLPFHAVRGLTPTLQPHAYFAVLWNDLSFASGYPHVLPL
eukprot:COSAG01_NODE_860_length_13064_cov_23.466949_22_plen_63_part_00